MKIYVIEKTVQWEGSSVVGYFVNPPSVEDVTEVLFYTLDEDKIKQLVAEDYCEIYDTSYSIVTESVKEN